MILAIGSKLKQCDDQVAEYEEGTVFCEWQVNLGPGEYSVYAYADGSSGGARFTVTGAVPPISIMPSAQPSTQPNLALSGGPHVARITRVEFGSFSMFDSTVFGDTVVGPLETLEARINYTGADTTHDVMEAYLASRKGRFGCEFSRSPLLQAEGERSCGWTGVGLDAYKLVVLINGKVAAEKAITVLAGNAPPPKRAREIPGRFANPSPSKEEEFRKELNTPGCELLRRDGFDTSGCAQGYVNSDGALVGSGYMR
ncbi:MULTISPECIES: hypothetical protein [unclassified Bradyrhizobium]|uniref:hypothetical protein n=1 Tax=unclassified Bradyrhizobium TaxID=2631580 RepID=UPI0029169D23|nr:MULTISPECIES: hypothetical protein [unclassified Bradyrhizobium]